jgi:excisionase family DNA binding protein
MPVSSAAKLLGVSMSRVYQLIAAGKLLSQTINSTVLVESASVDALIAVRERSVRRAA